MARDAASSGIDGQVETAERAPARVRGDNRDPRDLVRDPVMPVAGDDGVHEARGQRSRDLKDLFVRAT